MERFDVVIIGAGMAGASLAASLGSRAGRVLIIEEEDHPGFHATGRSAAFWTESYGGEQIQPLTTASGPYLHEHGFLVPRGALTLANPGREAEVESFASRFAAQGIRIELLERKSFEARIPSLRPGWNLAAHEPDCCDIDVAALHQHYLSKARQAGTMIACRAGLRHACRKATSWDLKLTDGRTVGAAVVVNAAGAWADDVARICDVAPLGIAPLRRTMVQLRTNPATTADLPLVLDMAGTFYFKPEGGRLWLSPHDETPSPACDAAPEETDVALAIERLETVVDWQAERVEHRWAGLRSFAPDRLPVYGFDPRQPGFFWCAGQGGFGIQTAPAASAMAAGLLLGETGGRLDTGPFSPSRFY